MKPDSPPSIVNTTARDSPCLPFTTLDQASVTAAGMAMPDWLDMVSVMQEGLDNGAQRSMSRCFAGKSPRCSNHLNGSVDEDALLGCPS